MTTQADCKSTTSRRTLLAGGAALGLVPISVAVGATPSIATAANPDFTATDGLPEFDGQAILKRFEHVLDALRTHVICEGWPGPDEVAAARALKYFVQLAAGVEDDDEFQFAVDFIYDHGQSLDWIFLGNPRVMICHLAASSYKG